MKNLIYETDSIKVYVKKQEMMEAGNESDLAAELFFAAIKGFTTFASHLKKPEAFYKEIKRNMNKMIESYLK